MWFLDHAVSGIVRLMKPSSFWNTERKTERRTWTTEKRKRNTKIEMDELTCTLQDRNASLTDFFCCSPRTKNQLIVKIRDRWKICAFTDKSNLWSMSAANLSASYRYPTWKCDRSCTGNGEPVSSFDDGFIFLLFVFRTRSWNVDGNVQGNDTYLLDNLKSCNHLSCQDVSQNSLFITTIGLLFL